MSIIFDQIEVGKIGGTQDVARSYVLLNGIGEGDVPKVFSMIESENQTSKLISRKGDLNLSAGSLLALTLVSVFSTGINQSEFAGSADRQRSVIEVIPSLSNLGNFIFQSDIDNFLAKIRKSYLLQDEQKIRDYIIAHDFSMSIISNVVANAKYFFGSSLKNINFEILTDPDTEIDKLFLTLLTDIEIGQAIKEIKKFKEIHLRDVKLSDFMVDIA